METIHFLIMHTPNFSKLNRRSTQFNVKLVHAITYITLKCLLLFHHKLRQTRLGTTASKTEYGKLSKSTTGNNINFVTFTNDANCDLL
jgi:hypothetical protein